MSVNYPQSAEPASPSPPRYRGAAGARTAALFTFGVTMLLGIGLGAMLWLATRSLPQALSIVARFALVGVAAGGAAGLSRWICNTATDRLLTVRFTRGESSGSFGLLGGLVLAGYLAQTATAGKESTDAALAVGQVLELSGPTLEGGRYDLATLRGKVVLVDFWASWCGPCLAEMPNVRAAYDQYHADGLEVVGVSLDFERDALTRFLKTHPEPWPQVYFNAEGERGFDNPLAKRYGIDAIPQLVVIDREGRIAARDVRGRQIDSAVAEALGKPVYWGDRVATAGSRLLGWFMGGIFVAPWWLLLPCTLGGAALFAFTERLLRQALA